MRIRSAGNADLRTLRFASISGGMIVSVMAEAAILNAVCMSRPAGYKSLQPMLTGAITVALMPCLAPSCASVLVNAMRPILAAL